MNPAVRLPKIILCLFLLTVLTVVLFSYTVFKRQAWFGVLALANHHALTGETIQFTQFWYHESPLKLKFGMYIYPPSIENPTLTTRMPYVSYPVGVLLPIYAIAKTFHHEPTPSLVMGYNLANHFLISLFLAYVAFIFCLFMRLPLFSCFLFATCPLGLSQLLPYPMYYFQNVFWSDQAVILLFVLMLFFELLRDGLSGGVKNQWIVAAQAFVLFYGAFTDWLFLVVAGVIFIKRFLNGEYNKSLKDFVLLSVKFWAPLFLAIGLFLYQVWSLNSIPVLIERYMVRTGHTAQSVKVGIIEFSRYFWGTHVSQGFGQGAVVFILLGILFCFVGILAVLLMKLSRRLVPSQLHRGVVLAALVLLPCLLQVYFLKDHSMIHNFSALKFIVPLSLVPFVILPVTAGALLLDGKNIKPIFQKNIFIALAVFCSLGAFIYALVVHPGYKSLFPTKNMVFENLGGFIAQNTGYNDIVFSTKGEIDENPLFLIYSKKRVYLVRNVQDILSRLNGVKGPYTINLLTTTQMETDPGIRELMAKAYDVRRSNGLFLYKVQDVPKTP